MSVKAKFDAMFQECLKVGIDPNDPDLEEIPCSDLDCEIMVEAMEMMPDDKSFDLMELWPLLDQLYRKRGVDPPWESEECEALGREIREQREDHIRRTIF